MHITRTRVRCYLEEPILLGGFVEEFGLGGLFPLGLGLFPLGLGLVAPGLVALATFAGLLVLTIGLVVRNFAEFIARFALGAHDTRQAVFGFAADVHAVVGHLVLVKRSLLFDDRVERELIQKLQMSIENLALELVPQILAHLRIAHDVGRHGALKNRLVDRVPALLAVLLVLLLSAEIEHLKEMIPEIGHHPVPEEQKGVLGLEDLDLQLALLVDVDGHRRRSLHRRQAIVDDLRHESGNHGNDLAIPDVAVDSGLLAIGIEYHHFVVQAELPRILLHLGQKLAHDTLAKHSVNTVQFHLNLLVFYFPWLFGATRIRTIATSKKLGRFSFVVTTSQRYQPQSTPQTINKNSLNFIIKSSFVFILKEQLTSMPILYIN